MLSGELGDGVGEVVGCVFGEVRQAGKTSGETSGLGGERVADEGEDDVDGNECKAGDEEEPEGGDHGGTSCCRACVWWEYGCEEAGEEEHKSYGEEGVGRVC